MGLADSIRQMLPPVDPRAPQQIESDIDDEFAFHLAMLEAEERAAGADADTAQARARKRFGDAAKWRKRCRNIALKERVMLQRINFALTILLMLVVVGVGAQVYMTQRHNTLALQEITSQIGKMRYDAEAALQRAIDPPDADSNSDRGASGNVVYYSGYGKQGQYQIPSTGQLTVLRLLAAAGINLDSPAFVTVRRRGAHSDETVVLDARVRDLRQDSSKDIVLRGDDLVHTSMQQPEDASAADSESRDTHSSALAAEYEELSKLIGVWQLDEPAGRLPEEVRFLLIKNEPPGQSARGGRGSRRMYPKIDVDLHSGDSGIIAEFEFDRDLIDAGTSSNDLRARARDHGASLTGTNALIIDGGWRLTETDSLVLDLRKLLDLDRDLSEELRQLVMVPLRYTRVTQPLSEREQEGPPRVAHIFGDVSTPGKHEIPSSGAATLQHLLEQAGLSHDHAGKARVFLMKAGGPSATLDYDLSELRDPSFPPVPLDPDSVVQVIADGGTKPADAQPVDSSKQLAPESSADEDARRPSDQLIGVWRLTEGHNRVPEQEHFLAIEPTNSFPATTIRRGRARGIKVSFFGADGVAMQGRDGPADFSLINIDGGWRLESPDTLVLDLRPAFEHAHTDALRQFVMVPLIYTRVTQQLSIREEEGTRHAVHIFGDISSSGQYEIPKSGKLALQDLLADADGSQVDRGIARIYMMNDKGETATLDYDLSELHDPSFPPVPLDPDSVVQVIADQTSRDTGKRGEDAAQIEYDMRNLVGIWRLIGDLNVPDQFETLVISDRSPAQPPGMIKQHAKPWTGFTLADQEPQLSLLFKPQTAGTKSTAMLEVTVFAQSNGRRQPYNQAQPTIDATWSVLSENQIAIDLKPLLDTMTAEARAALSEWFNEPLHYERVTAAYTERIASRPPQHVHIVGIKDEPQRFAIPDDGELSAQDVLRRAGFTDLENVEANIWQMTDEEPEFENRLRPEHIDNVDMNLAPIPLRPDAVIIVSRRISRDEDKSKPRHRGVVYLAGDAERAGTYNLPGAGELTVSRLLTAAGVDLQRDDLTITVRRRFDNDMEETIVNVSASELSEDQSKDIKLKPNDLVTVRETEE